MFECLRAIVNIGACVNARTRERERKREKNRESSKEREKVSVCVCGWGWGSVLNKITVCVSFRKRGKIE